MYTILGFSSVSTDVDLAMSRDSARNQWISCDIVSTVVDTCVLSNCSIDR